MIACALLFLERISIVQPHETIVTATAAQLSQECSNEALLQLSTEIAGYDTYKHRLGLSDAEIGAIDQIIVNIPGRFHAALKKWKSKSIILDNPSNSTATYDRLVEIATKNEDGKAVRSIHKACVEHTSELHSEWSLWPAIIFVSLVVYNYSATV